MIYANNDRLSVNAMERARTGNYGEEDIDKYICPNCGSVDWDEVYYRDDECVGCTECIDVRREIV